MASTVGTAIVRERCPIDEIAVGSLFEIIRTKEHSMNWDRIEGNWKQFTGKVKEQWGKLTDDDIAQINGNREQLEGKIQARYGFAKDQVRRDVDDWIGRQ
jgi:uncharacterized protein YjbJ (UPF0337 family)